MFILLFLIYLIVFFVGLNIFRTRLNPITAFTVGFVGSMCVCLANYDKWGIDSFHINTFCILFFGCVGFLLGCFWVQNKYGKGDMGVDNSYRAFEINKIYLWGYLLFVIAIVIYSFKYLIDVTGADDLSQAAFINYHSGFVEGDSSQYQLPLIPRLLKSSVLYLNFYFLFILANKMVHKEPLMKNLDLLAICAVSSLGGITTGSRGSLFEPILYFFCVYLCLRNREGNHKGNKRNIRKLLYVVLGGLGALFLFFKAGTLFGRETTDSDFMDYMSGYVGAQPKNLDLFMNEYHKPNPLPGSYTFSTLLSSFVEIKPVYEMSMPRWANGFSLGNVYSGFAVYYYDFGIVGTFFFLFFLGIFFQFLYVWSLKGKGLQKRYFLFKIFLYAYFLQGLIFNFFGERVCRLISPLTLKCIIVVYVFDILVRRFTKCRVVIV